MSIITKTGDNGSTWAGYRMPKSSLKIHLLGELDELNCWVGHVFCQKYRNCTARLAFIWVAYEDLERIQAVLLEAGACVSMRKHYNFSDETLWLEEEVWKMESELPSLRNFVLPQWPSEIQIARAVCRRAERTAVLFSQGEDVSDLAVYLNRLSDYLFTLARWLCHINNVTEKIWKPSDK